MALDKRNDSKDDSLHTRLVLMRRCVALFGAPIDIRDKLPVPAEDRIGRGDRGDFRQELVAELLRLHGQPPPLIIREPYALAAKLVFERPVLLEQILDHFAKLAINPSRHSHR